MYVVNYVCINVYTVCINMYSLHMYVFSVYLRVIIFITVFTVYMYTVRYVQR